MNSKQIKMNLHFNLKILPTVFLLVLIACVSAQARLVKGVKGRGEAAVVGITPEAGQHLALQRARADAIEQAAGVKILGATLVRSNMLAGDFIKTFTRGFIVAERIKWLPLEQFQPDVNVPPVPMYRVEITADVEIPEKSALMDFVVQASLNKQTFAAGESAVLEINVSQDAWVAVFNIRADDKIVMLYPNSDFFAHKVDAGEKFYFPPARSNLTLEMVPLSGHRQDTEAFLIAAFPAKDGNLRFDRYFQSEKLYSVPEFFKVYAKIADKLAETIVPYVVGQ